MYLVKAKVGLFKYSCLGFSHWLVGRKSHRSWNCRLCQFWCSWSSKGKASLEPCIQGCCCCCRPSLCWWHLQWSWWLITVDNLWTLNSISRAWRSKQQRSSVKVYDRDFCEAPARGRLCTFKINNLNATSGQREDVNSQAARGSSSGYEGNPRSSSWRGVNPHRRRQQRKGARRRNAERLSPLKVSELGAARRGGQAAKLRKPVAVREGIGISCISF